MKTFFPAFAAILAWPLLAWPAEPAHPIPLSAIVAISNAQASTRPPVAFQATVTYYRPYAKNLFVQDGDSAIFVHPAVPHTLAPGDRVLVRGTLHESFRPYVEHAEISVIGHGALPKPRRPTYDEMIRAKTDCQLVTVRAVIQSADLVPNLQSPHSTTDVSIVVDGGRATASIDSDDAAQLKNLLDSEVEMTGVQSGVFDNKMQLTGILIHIQSLDQVKILKRAAVDPWSIPITPMDRILAGYRPRDFNSRQRVHGTITYYQPGVALVLQDGSKSIWITTGHWGPLHLGAVADAIGFPLVEYGFLTLTRAEIRETAERAPVTPALFTWRQLALGGNDGHSHVYDLVSVEGRVVAQVRQATQDEYVLDAGGHLFSAIVRHPSPHIQAAIPPIHDIPLGTYIRVTGICMLTDANPFNGEVPFNILMRNLDDIVVLAQPPWMNVRNLSILVALLFCVVLVIGLRSWAVERRIRRETSAVAYLEQRRSRILEDINGERPLAEIVEQITEVVSFRLQGAPCWCVIASGATLGNPPPSLDNLRILPCEIPSRSGAPLGTIYAAFDMLANPLPLQAEALSMGASLASVAIGTRRLYSDLLHRSEFDQLTEVQNRFAMEKQLDALIDRARVTAGIFGLIYIDLDRFKQINDECGHNVGDAYLQQAASRMKRQLRPGDVLARPGGDEFAVLLPVVRTRADVLEIAARLEHCFDEPFIVQGHTLHGSASMGIAIYPEDALTRDALLRRADAAMYVAKHDKRTAKDEPKHHPTPKLAS